MAGGEQVQGGDNSRQRGTKGEGEQRTPQGWRTAIVLDSHPVRTFQEGA